MNRPQTAPGPQPAVPTTPARKPGTLTGLLVTILIAVVTR
ncbi:hypothetical protein UA75_07620 [Actinoalloteichus sp. GBA129-24]|uniref:Uncharacterized protein n=1 Tax=Actinoalloteichus fjordicus TaxID=1612552 RepID=A0AAC9PR92_9PSEU|nr:hypothetical protein UA74_07635 [Actinoalloteichus fjordicus]APU19543.1 hypothetical protein UA75_07620 [Actinoalloteichus sp. GBA129-24]